MTARGIRNNNPANIRKGGAWEGLAPVQGDGEFCSFESMAYGVRALFKVLLTYRRNYHLETVHAIISRFAPECENNTKAYIDAVASALGVKPHQTLNLANTELLIRLAQAIVRHECGKDADLVTAEDWEQGADLAGLGED